MSLSLITPPAAEPVTLADAKAHLKLDTADEDALVTSLITAARARAEWHTGRALVTQSWVLKLDTFPASLIAEIPLPPLQSVTEIAFTTPDGLRSVQPPASNRVDTASQPGRVIFSQAPQQLRASDAVEIAFTAGYGAAAAVPQAIRQAILIIVADLYSHRGDEDAICGPQAQTLLAPYRVFKLK
jgi:uncharacterized phiE125 gp8 family phage protein